MLGPVYKGYSSKRVTLTGGQNIAQVYKQNFTGRVNAYLHAAICRADLSAPRNREANRRVCFGLCGRD